MKKQAMNCAFTAVQEEELLRQTAAFFCSLQFICVFFLETRNCEWDPRRFSRPSSSREGSSSWLSCLPTLFFKLWYPTAYPNSQFWYRELFPHPAYLCSRLLLRSPTSYPIRQCHMEECDLFLCLAAFLHTESLLFCLFCVMFIQSGQSCWNSMLTKSRQAQVNVNTPNSLLFFFFP